MKETITHILSEKNLVERSNATIINQPRYYICGKCKHPVIRLTGKGYHGHHQTINGGFFCRNCKILYCNDKLVKAVSYTEETQN